MNGFSLNPEDISAMVGKGSAASVESVERILERFLEVASVKSVYDSPVEHGENMIIPAAEVLGGVGFGMGVGMGMGPGKMSGREETESSEGETPLGASESGTGVSAEGVGGGSGGGGGGRVFARPVAVVISGPGGVRVEPVVDATKIALAFFTALGFMIGMAARMRRSPSLEE